LPGPRGRAGAGIGASRPPRHGLGPACGHAGSASRSGLALHVTATREARSVSRPPRSNPPAGSITNRDLRRRQRLFFDVTVNRELRRRRVRMLGTTLVRVPQDVARRWKPGSRPSGPAATWPAPPLPTSPDSECPRATPQARPPCERRSLAAWRHKAQRPPPGSGTRGPPQHTSASSATAQGRPAQLVTPGLACSAVAFVRRSAFGRCTVRRLGPFEPRLLTHPPHQAPRTFQRHRRPRQLESMPQSTCSARSTTPSSLHAPAPAPPGPHPSRT
jgi:hypothetical protein